MWAQRMLRRSMTACRQDLGGSAGRVTSEARHASQGLTTLMVRNIPTTIEQDMLLEMWPLDG